MLDFLVYSPHEPKTKNRHAKPENGMPLRTHDIAAAQTIKPPRQLLKTQCTLLLKCLAALCVLGSVGAESAAPCTPTSGDTCSDTCSDTPDTCSDLKSPPPPSASPPTISLIKADAAPTCYAERVQTTGRAFGSNSLDGYCDDIDAGKLWVPNRYTEAGKAPRPVRGIHCWDNLNDGLYGNDHSWIGDTDGAKAGVVLPAPRTIVGIQLARDLGGGGEATRAGGTITVEYSATANADATPWASSKGWKSAGSISGWAANAHNYYMFNTPVEADGLRITVAKGGPVSGTCVDELDIYAVKEDLYSGPPPTISLTKANTAPTCYAAKVQTTGWAFGSNSLDGYCDDIDAGKLWVKNRYTEAGKAPRPVRGIHCWDNLNDGLYGNDHSWIGDTDGAKAGVVLPAPRTIVGIQLARDLGGGGEATRAGGTITVEYSATAYADATPWASSKGWKSAGSISGWAANAHNYYMFSTPVEADGLRITVAKGGPVSGTCVDELDIYAVNEHFYAGCFANEIGPNRISTLRNIDEKNGVREIDRRVDTVASCFLYAQVRGLPGFGMEYPAASPEPGQAECVPLTNVPPAGMKRVPDAECETETFDGFRLGGTFRTAVYKITPPPVYTLMSDARSWSDAIAACQDAGLQLASVHSPAENELLIAAAAGQAVWIGGSTDAASEGTWKWSNGLPLSYTNWDPDEPNNEHNEDCLEFGRGPLKDLDEYPDCVFRCPWKIPACAQNQKQFVCGTWKSRDCAMKKKYVCETPR